LATWRAEAGKLDEAIAVFTELLSDETRILGADHGRWSNGKLAKQKRGTAWALGAVVYARISEDHERAESVPTQIANATRHAERMGWNVVRVFKDEGRSGYTGEHDLVTQTS
jgi:hypothetical protein